MFVSMPTLSNSINLVITCHDHLISSCQRYVAILICSNAAIVRNILYLGEATSGGWDAASAGLFGHIQ